jgi:uncharacterized protein YegP (UPF0339 family)
MPDARVYRNEETGQWYWRLQADNGEIIASGEGHTSKRDAKRAMMTALMAAAEVVEGEPRDER